MKFILLLLFACLIFAIPRVCAQNQTVFIQGTVIDSASGTPLQQVSVFQNSSGRGTLTDQDGRYMLALSRNGILRFSYLGYKDVTVQVKTLAGDQNINIRMGILPFFTPELNITSRKLYKLDSLNNRRENSDIFAARRNASSHSVLADERPYSAGFVMSPSVLYNNYISPHARRVRAYRKILEKSEKTTYIENRFNRQIVNRITGLGGADLDTFMVKTRPAYDWLAKSSDYDLYNYIQEKFSHYRPFHLATGK